MKAKFFVPVLVTCFISFAFVADTEPVWEGHWTENWGVGQKTDINYHDKYTIQKDQLTGILKIWASEKSQYLFRDVVINGRNLDFKLINTTGYDTMPYHLEISDDNTMMRGYAYSVWKEKRNIEWYRDEMRNTK